MQHLLPQVPYFKANLHTHTTISDGVLSAEETKARYKALGYSILALTDHSVVAEHQSLNDEDFLLLTGVEVDVEEDVIVVNGRRSPTKTRHFCLIGKDPHKLWLPFRDPDMLPQGQPYFDRCSCEYMPRVYTADSFNAIIKKANEEGFFVIYNHPVWSQENYPDYEKMRGLWAMEYRNSMSIASGFDENNGQIYQDLLMLGNRLMPVMADDMHRPAAPNGFSILGNSFTMIGAQTLEYDAVIQAMEKGDLYSSCGPLIYELTWDGRNIGVRCSPVAKIQVVTQTRAARLVQGDDLQEAAIDMQYWLQRSQADPDSFFRLVITAADGSYAVTRAYWFSELNK